MAVLHAEVLQEANDARKKIKFYKVLESCGWVARNARIDPGERVNFKLAAFERAETVSATGPRAQLEGEVAAEPAPVPAPLPPASPTSAASGHRLLQHLRRLQYLQPALEATGHGKSTVASEKGGFVRPPRCRLDVQEWTKVLTATGIRAGWSCGWG